MPLDALVACLPDSSPAVKAAAARLVANTVELVGVGVGLPADEAMRRRTWMYFPEADSPYYRVTVLSNYAASNAPDAASYSLLTESAHPRTERVDRDALVEATCGALERDGLLPRGAPIRSLWHRTLARGYPVPTRGRDDALATLHAPDVPALTQQAHQWMAAPIVRNVLQVVQPGAVFARRFVLWPANPGHVVDALWTVEPGEFSYREVVGALRSLTDNAILFRCH